MTDQEIEDTITSAVALKPDSSEDIATIPTVSIDNINLCSPGYPIIEEDACDSGIIMVSHELGSASGILCADFGVDVSNISFSDIGCLQLFDSLSAKTGTSNYAEDELIQLSDANTGGVHAHLLIIPVNNEDHNGKDTSPA